MDKDRKFSWETVSVYCFTFGGITGAAVIFFLLLGCAAGNEILKNTGISFSIPSAMGFVGGVISQIIDVVNYRTAKKKNMPSDDDACEESDTGDTAGENDKEMPPEYIRSVDSNVSGYEGMDPDSEGDSETATDGKTASGADMAKKEYMVEISEQSAKNIKVVAKDSREAVELAKEIYRNESPFLSDKSVQTTVNFWAEPDDSRYESFFCEKEGGKIII